MAEKNAPATGGLNCRVTSTVTPIEVTAETAAPMRFRVLPRETSASFPPPLLLAGPAGLTGWRWVAAGAGPGLPARRRSGPSRLLMGPGSAVKSMNSGGGAELCPGLRLRNAARNGRRMLTHMPAAGRAQGFAWRPGQRPAAANGCDPPSRCGGPARWS